MGKEKMMERRVKLCYVSKGGPTRQVGEPWPHG